MGFNYGVDIWSTFHPIFEIFNNAITTMIGIKQVKINLMKGRIDQRSRLFQTWPTKCRLEVIQPFKSNPDADITQLVENASQLELLDTV